MVSIIIKLALAASAVICLFAAPVGAQTNTGVASFAGPIVSGVATTASIAKGKAKRILVAQARVLTEIFLAGLEICDMSYVLKANGVTMAGASAFATHARGTCQCESGCTGCTLSSVAYLDLDAAEAANPGVFKNQPIDVTLELTIAGQCSGDAGAATLAVQMVKK